MLFCPVFAATQPCRPLESLSGSTAAPSALCVKKHNHPGGKDSTCIQFPSREAAVPLMVKWRRPSRTASRDFVLGGPPPMIFVVAQHAAPELGAMQTTRGTAQCLKTVSKSPL